MKNWLKANGYPNARRTFAGDGKQLGDVEFHPSVCLEVKDVAQSAWPSWRQQAVDECAGRIPVVVRRTRGVPDVGLWVAQTPWLTILGDSFDQSLDLVATTCPRTERYWMTVPFRDVVSTLLTLTERTA